MINLIAILSLIVVFKRNLKIKSNKNIFKKIYLLNIKERNS